MAGDATRRRRRLPFLRLRALLSGGLVLGLGAVMTLASWNDSEYATTTLSTSVFNTESSVNGAAYADNAVSPGPSVTFSGAVFAPGDVQYWNILTRTKAKSIPGTLSVPAPVLGGANTATLSPYFVYRVVNTTATCNAAAFTTSPVWVVGNGTTKRALTAGQEAGVTISLPAATPTLPSAATGLCFEMTLLDTAPIGVQNQVSTATWRFVATSS
ncbi:putative ribosomally synthesized peptide with SipW-like signal peptide [Conyzicola lurida]|uniref:Putative ribosomally synthesized peptide with SipW-like signal peptide n=1 Tax=Conyzicola lurida TaxID=1172621 RepID=A0A841AM02_9MICO|nr:SipW-dependent-type signal peptide-containing protein [Conyzicola lurida]MBB5842761.1 putative ribosomally synthesized peptide with SipW-like signal peptide [Conyzicola lurida]